LIFAKQNNKMEKQTIVVKGMVCDRCIMVVKIEMENLGYESVDVSLGEVSFISASVYYKPGLEASLALHGFSLLENRKIKIIYEVKNWVNEVYSGDFDFPYSFRFTKFLTEKTGSEYNALSDAFISIEKKTIEQYVIEHRINKVKELLVYTSLTLADIAFKLNYNSVAHLSTQFKQRTGLVPSFFKTIKKQKDKIGFSDN